jgi:hypothetical protein
VNPKRDAGAGAIFRDVPSKKISPGHLFQKRFRIFSGQKMKNRAKIAKNRVFL